MTDAAPAAYAVGARLDLDFVMLRKQYMATKTATSPISYLDASVKPSTDTEIRFAEYNGHRISLVEYAYDGSEPRYRLQVSPIQTDGGLMPWDTGRDFWVSQRNAVYGMISGIKKFATGMLAGNKNLLLVGDTDQFASEWATQKMAWVRNQYTHADGVYVTVDGMQMPVAVDLNQVPDVGYVSLNLVPGHGLSTTPASRQATPAGEFWMDGKPVMQRPPWQDRKTTDFKFWQLTTCSALLAGVNIACKLYKDTTFDNAMEIMDIFASANVPQAAQNSMRATWERGQVAAAASTNAEKITATVNADSFELPCYGGGSLKWSEILARNPHANIWPVTRGGSTMAPLTKMVYGNPEKALAYCVSLIERGYTFIVS